MIEENKKPLSKKHQRFVNEYLKQWNGTRAYMAVYPNSSYGAAMVSASELLRTPKIAEVEAARLNEAHMSADEALKLMADIARGDVSQIMDVSSVGFNLDMSKAQKLGLTKLIKKVKQKTTIYSAKKESEEDREVTELEVELYPADAALERILKVHGKFTDRVDVTNSDGTLKPETMKPSEIAERVAALLKANESKDA